MITSVEEAGTPPHQLEAVFQSVLVVPSQVPVAYTVTVAEPVWPDPSFTVTVKLLPATVGVTLAPLNTPEVNAADVPVTPAVPPNVTVEPKLVTVLPFGSCAVIVVMAKAVPAVCGDEMAEIAK
jgi:hypothetical protein